MTNNKARTTLASNAPTSPPSVAPLHANNVSLIDVDNVSVCYGGEAVLDDVSFCVHPGEFIGLIGPNGAGKTTLLNVLLGLLRPTAGSLQVDQAAIGYIPQRGSAADSQVPISVLEVVQLGSKGDKAGARQALQAVQLSEFAARRFSELSGGQQQRVLIAKALAASPKLLILDEPTTGIDEQSQQHFYELLAGLHGQGMTIVMVSHDVDAVLKQVSRLVCLQRSIVYDGPPQHFEADKYLPQLYGRQHQILHHGTPDA